MQLWYAPIVSENIEIHAKPIVHTVHNPLILISLLWRFLMVWSLLHCFKYFCPSLFFFFYRLCFFLCQTWSKGQSLLDVMIRASWLNPDGQRCGNKTSLSAALFLHACGALKKWPHRQPVGKQDSGNIVLKSTPSPFTLRTKINLTESGFVVNKVRSTDEWVEEAVMSDIVHQSARHEMLQQRQKDTGGLLRQNNTKIV